VLAAIAATGTSLAIPGLGLVIAGPLAAAAAGAGAGAATGGLLGALVGWGIPEERVKHYESGIKQGGILMGVKPRSDEDAAYFEQHWRSNKGDHIYRPGMTTTASALTSGAAMRADNDSDIGIDGDSGEQAVVGVYDNDTDAQNAVDALVASGFARHSVQLNPGSDTTRTTATAQSPDSGGIGGFFRSLFGMDEQQGYHDAYAESMRRGSHVVTVDARNYEEAERASEIMSRFNAVDIDERTSQWKQQGWSGYDASAPRLSDADIQKERASYLQRDTTAESSRIPVIEEELKVGKRAVQRGGVRVFQRVREKPVHESVQLREEHVKVERHAVDKPATAADLAAFKEGAIELRETSEEAVVSKTARVVEEVEVSKQVSQRTEQIQDTVRRTDVEIEQLGASGTTARTVDDTDFRSHWQSTYGTAGGRYEDYDAAYRYGSTMAGSGRFSNYRWDDVEPQLRSDWESSHPGSTWDKVKDAVRYGAERLTGKRSH